MRQARRICTGLGAGLLALALVAPLPALGGTKVPDSQGEITLSFAPVVKRAAPAVVNIYTKKVVERNLSPFANDPFFRQFFGDMIPGGMTQRRVESSLGSGVIVDPNGIVVSNYHVVGEADSIRVVLADRREFPAKVIFADKKADLAVVRLEGAHNLPTLKLRNSDTLEVGELVLAIGDPFGVGQTVTSGIVSALARSGLPGGKQAGYYIQTDAPINPGNSGGALVDMSGRLIGINTSILSRSGGSNGIGFAVPANLVARVLAEAEHGRKQLDRPWLGLSGQAVTGDLAGALGLSRPEGVVINQIHPDSPFAKAEIAQGDVLLALDGEAVNAPAELNFRAATLGTGGRARVRYLHDGHEHTTTVALEPAPDRPPRDRTTLRRPRGLAGLTVMNVNPSVIDQYGLPLNSSGLLVEGVDGPAQASGLQPGDLILSADGHRIADVGAFERALRRDGRPSLEVQRDGQRGTLNLGGG